MRINIFTLILAGIVSSFSYEPTIAQKTISNHLPKATPKGEGKIDTRRDNIGYWKRMADLGYVEVAPQIPVPRAIYKGSEIKSPGKSFMILDSPDVAVTTQNSTQSENSVFVNPSNSNTLLNSNNSTNNPVSILYGADYPISTNGGTTWGGSINGAGGNNSGDPATSISIDGRYYVGFINNNSGQSVAYSTNGGSSWTAVVVSTVPNHVSNLLDKNHLIVDISPSSAFQGYLYGAWTRFATTNNNQIMIARSTNGGVNWSTPVNISAGVNAGSFNHGVNLQVGPNGQLYIVWAIYDTWPSDENALGFNKSTDGGSTFGTAYRIISNIKGIRTSETTKNQRVNSFPSMAVDISGGAHSGTIYVVWTNIGVPGLNSGSDRDIYLIKSTDQGSTWSSPLRVNQDPIGLGKEHYFPWITCDPTNGNLSVIFYDDRDISSTQCETWVANSFDGGNIWENFRVSDVAFTPSSIPGLASGYMGDYLGITSRSGSVYPLWTDNRTGTCMSYVSPYNPSLLPVVAFRASDTIPCLNSTITLTDLTSRTPASWNWSIFPSGFSFVDGTSSSSQNPHVAFTAYGNYSVSLVATNPQGSDTLTKTNYISVSRSSADFSASSTQVVINYQTFISIYSNCNTNSYSWNFGSGASPGTATSIGPVAVTYSTTGLKTVTLILNDTITKTKTNYINVITDCAVGSTTCDEYISNVIIGAINNSSACSSGGYGNYTALSTKVSPGYPYNITVTDGLLYAGDQCGIWVDWNHDGYFSSLDEAMSVTGPTVGGLFTATITPPANAVKGNNRLRTRITYTGEIDPCGIAPYGEVEDYTIYVGTPGLWVGGTAGLPSDWNTAGNWDDARVPLSTTNIIIPQGRAYYPVITSTFQCNNMQINDGGTVTIQSGALNINGNLVIGQGGSGILNINAGTCNVIGTLTAQAGSSVHIANGGLLDD